MTHPSHLPTERTDSPLETAGAAVRELGHSVADGAQQLGRTASREARHVGDSAHQWWTHKREDARHAVDEARQRAAAVSERAQSHVRERPLMAMLAAVGLGAMAAGLALLALRRGR
jgi:ElaB/YqjD/DUF883 family membrane-anchored ribosome-binding protein